MARHNDKLRGVTSIPVREVRLTDVDKARRALAGAILVATGDTAPWTPDWRPTQEQIYAMLTGLDMLGIGAVPDVRTSTIPLHDPTSAGLR